MTHIDKRTLQTRSKIESAMVTLCQNQEAFARLTGPKIASTAGISRQTFYRYYLTPKQVITSLIERHLSEFLKTFRLQNLTARKMVLQLMTIWQDRTTVLELVEWSDSRYEFIRALAQFNQRIASQNQVHLINEQTVCNVYAAATYMFLRDYVLKGQWSQEQATDLLLHLTNNMDQIF
ncbi:TetR family transcriptional regulator [Secundilactobacillus pentosiphilus]|uniref:TetR family transcriptional regulator n=1 Tax=Secundilactobacillus pentosiphilus TaxID=1714682 RepID=A0A1Z5IMP4_9LACO|nr:TetR/AcrR family transcriptional regulator [Secundilactobacillus pentosiphilus]GAX03015.1 TetR family transcriptional regulator [Secundilactobacillus pentosiphilus]